MLKIQTGNIENTPTTKPKIYSKLRIGGFLKLECLKLTSSFEARKAYVALKKATYHIKNTGLIAILKANHILAVICNAGRADV